MASPNQRREKGRGAGSNRSGRFEPLRYEADPDAEETDFAEEAGDCASHDAPRRRTLFLKDPSRSIVATNESPDLGFDASVNPYRGCEHGCIYCYARPTHEYLGFSAGLDFETRILVKQEAPALLRQALSKPGWRPRVLALSGVTDPYQPVERRLGITRGCLDVLLEFRNPVEIVTKSRLVTRDADRLAALAAFDCTAVSISVTTLDATLHRAMEPRAPSPALRLEAIEQLADAGVPVGVLVGPIVPGLNDHEIPAILAAAARAGAGFAGRTVLRLPHGVKELFDEWLQQHYPDRRRKVLNRVREVRGGRLNDPRFGTRQLGEGRYAEHIDRLFELGRQRADLAAAGPVLSTEHFRRPGVARQATLFD